jgi:hypothetical protein
MLTLNCRTDVHERVGGKMARFGADAGGLLWAGVDPGRSSHPLTVSSSIVPSNTALGRLLFYLLVSRFYLNSILFVS